jgi:hypothetical protein
MSPKMPRRACWILLLLIVPMQGCFVGSLQPLYDADNVVFEKNLLGSWALENEKELMIIARSSKGEPQYTLIYLTESASSTYEVRLVEIAKTRYFDVYPRDGAKRGTDAHYLPTHSIWKLSLEGDSLKIAAMNEDWLKEQIDKKAVFVEGMRVEDDVVLTFPTTALQEFVRGNADKLFPQQSTWKRRK